MDPESSIVPPGMTWVRMSPSPSLVDNPFVEAGTLSIVSTETGTPVIAGSLTPPVGRLGVPVIAPSGMPLVTVMVTEAIVTVEAGAVTLREEKY